MVILMSALYRINSSISGTSRSTTIQGMLAQSEAADAGTDYPQVLVLKSSSFTTNHMCLEGRLRLKLYATAKPSNRSSAAGTIMPPTALLRSHPVSPKDLSLGGTEHACFLNHAQTIYFIFWKVSRVD